MNVTYEKSMIYIFVCLWWIHIIIGHFHRNNEIANDNAVARLMPAGLNMHPPPPPPTIDDRFIVVAWVV